MINNEDALSADVNDDSDAAARALGDCVHRYRTAQGRSLRDVAGAAGVDYSWLGRLERGLYRSPDARSLAKLARALDVDVEEFHVSAGFSTGRGLPGFAPYLRAKYNLPDDAVDQLESFFTLLNDKYHQKGGTDVDHHHTS